MKDEDKTKKQLVKELVEMRQQIAELEKSEGKRRLAEEAIRKSEDRYQELFNSIMEGVGIVDENEIIQYGNPAFAEIYEEESVEDLIGKSLLDYVDEKQKKVILSETKKRKEGKTSKYELEIITAKNNKKTITVSVSPRIGDKGKFAGGFGAIFDITDRKLAEKALIESEEKFRDFLENANDLIQSVDVNGRFLYVNKKWLETLGYSKGEVKKLMLIDILRKDQIPHCMEIFKRVCQGESFDNVEAVFVAKDGSEIYVKGNANARFKDGKFVATRGIFRDITKRKRAEEEMRRALEQERRFKKETAHYFFNPICIAEGYLYLAMNRVSPEEKETLEKILHAVQQIEKIVKNVVGISEIHE